MHEYPNGNGEDKIIVRNGCALVAEILGFTDERDISLYYESVDQLFKKAIIDAVKICIYNVRINKTKQQNLKSKHER